MKFLFFTLITLLCFFRIAEADIYSCDGQWTNKPCEGKVEKQFDEIVKPAKAEKKSTPSRSPVKAKTRKNTVETLVIDDSPAAKEKFRKMREQISRDKKLLDQGKTPPGHDEFKKRVLEGTVFKDDKYTKQRR